MSDLYIDLKDQIEELWERRRELLAIRVSPPGPSANEKQDQRQRIDEEAISILEKITALERIEDDLKASQITVTGLTEDQKAKAERAMAALSQSIQKEQAFDAMMKTVEGLLSAADTINSTAKS